MLITPDNEYSFVDPRSCFHKSSVKLVLDKGWGDLALKDLSLDYVQQMSVNNSFPLVSVLAKPKNGVVFVALRPDSNITSNNQNVFDMFDHK